MAATLSVVSLGSVSRNVLELVASAAHEQFGLVPTVDPPLAEPHYAFNPTRKQHNALSIVRKLGQAHMRPGIDAILAVANFDLFEPEADFVLGDADRDLHAAVIAIHRLRGGREDERFARRVQLLSIWAAGRATGVRSCDDARCVMNLPAHPDDLDRRNGNFCATCKQIASRMV